MKTRPSVKALVKHSASLGLSRGFLNIAQPWDKHAFEYGAE